VSSDTTPPDVSRTVPASPRQQNLPPQPASKLNRSLRNAREWIRLQGAAARHPYWNRLLVLWAVIPAAITSVWLFANVGFTILIPPAILFVFVAMAVEYVLVWMFTFGILASLQRASSRKTEYNDWLSAALHILLILGTLLGWLLGLLLQIARHLFPTLPLPNP
jgi:fatty acid desaturase